MPTRARHPRPSSRTAHRRGSIYVLVLLVSLIVLVSGLGAVMISRANVRATTATRDWSDAGAAARSGLEYALAVMNTSTSWRSDASSGTPIGPMRMGRAAVSIEIVDEADGNLANDASQPVRVYSAAQVGSSSRVYSMLAAPASTVGLDVLRCAVHTAGTLTVSGNAVVSGGPLSCAQSLSNSATLTSDIETSTLSSSGFINGYVKTGMPAKSMPGTAAWDALSAIATTIPWGVSGNIIDKQVLTSGVNTIGGGVNPSGVYAISVPATSTLTIHHTRFQASLLITLGAGSSLVVKDENLWDPADPTKPTLLVRGGLLSSASIQGSSNTLDESSNLNFNPVGAPYGGATDADTLDSYPNELHGLIHFIDAATSVTITNDRPVNIIGCVIVAGSVTIKNTATLTANPALLSAPPTGYSDASTIKMAPVPGSYRWEVADANP